MHPGSANLLRAASFIIGATLAVLVSVRLGILEPRRTTTAMSPTTRPDPAPVVVPLERKPTSATTPPRGLRPRPRKAPPAPVRPDTPPPSAARSAEPSPPPAPRPAEPPPPNAPPNLPAPFLRARRAMRQLEEIREATSAEVNAAATILGAVADELGHVDVSLCVDRYFLGEGTKHRLVPCWQRLEEAVR